MDELPQGASRRLPPHRTVGDDGTAGDACPGGNVAGVYSDVGLTYGACPSCNAPFVYLSNQNAWAEERAFEENLRRNPPDVADL